MQLPNQSGKLEPQSSEANCSVASDKAAYPMLQFYLNIAEKHNQHKSRGVRYTTEEKDIGLYNYILSGKKYHKFLSSNMPVISRSTLTRHLKANTQSVCEGKLLS